MHMSFNRIIPRYPDDREILHPLETPGRLETPVKKFKITEVRAAIKYMHSKKSPGLPHHKANPQGITVSRTTGHPPHL